MPVDLSFSDLDRVGDSDLRCGPVSLQQFRGEDLECGAERQKQVEENRQCWHAQVQERHQRTLAQAAEEKLYQAKAS